MTPFLRNEEHAQQGTVYIIYVCVYNFFGTHPKTPFRQRPRTINRKLSDGVRAARMNVSGLHGITPMAIFQLGDSDAAREETFRGSSRKQRQQLDARRTLTRSKNSMKSVSQQQYILRTRTMIFIRNSSSKRNAPQGLRLCIDLPHHTYTSSVP